MNQLRRRRANNDTDNFDMAIAKRKDMHMEQGGRSKRMAGKLFYGFTFSIGVAAVAMYALNGQAREPQEMLSKVFQLLTHNDLV